MTSLTKRLEDLRAAFALSAGQLARLSRQFADAMDAGLTGQDSCLKMLPSFLGRPTGMEQGRFIALDFGGTNVRTLLVELHGGGLLTVRQMLAASLKDTTAGYDYTAPTVWAEELFAFLAAQVATVAAAGNADSLGFTFSYPCRQTGANRAILLHWTKEIATAGVEGKDVGELLGTALARRGLGHLAPAAIINDTVGTLLTAAYQDPWTDIGSICGTGHNTCYLEPAPPAAPAPMIINMESGNFDAPPLTPFDAALDAASDKPGQQRLEKMAAGRYLGELVRLAAASLAAASPCFAAPVWQRADTLSGPDVALLVADTSRTLTQIEHWLSSRLGLASALAERAALKEIAALVTARSARLVAATYAGVLLRLDPTGQSRHTIAIDGSLYEKMPGYAALLQAALAELLPAGAGHIRVRLAKNGSGIGAAVAAAMMNEEGYGTSK
ncbi:hexokinase [Sporolituus thermophilus]|uniref:Hexokinase n=1 Tax=Sporolituus thermophilus DSM 23256 TaxID=1123285 RepID=A0A1G7PC90_9FIRM|nr:hexokinase [Sporolituus thermophilus]SDF83912.1 hexokinase [Sporolituus thermophilus DSM 23256]